MAAPRMCWPPSSPWQLHSSSSSHALGPKMRSSASTGTLSFNDYEASRTPAASSQNRRKSEAVDPWLQSWIEFQVDARINQALRGFVEGEFPAEGKRRRPEFDARAKEPSRLSGGEPHDGSSRDDSLLVVERTMTSLATAMEELQRAVTKETVTHPLMERRLAQLRAELHATQKELETSVSDRQASFQQKLREWQGDVERYVEREVNGTNMDKVSKIQKSCLEVLHSELTSVCAAQQRQCLEKLQQGMALQKQDRMQETSGLRAELQTCSTNATNLQKRFEQMQLDVQQQLDSFHARLQQEVSLHLQHTVEELRLETRSAIRSEASAVASLDQQLFVMDQRLGKRIDELAACWSLDQHDRMSEEPQKAVGLAADDELVTPRPCRPQVLACHDSAAQSELRRDDEVDGKEVISPVLRHFTFASPSASVAGNRDAQSSRSLFGQSSTFGAEATAWPEGRQVRGRLGSYFAASAPNLRADTVLPREVGSELRPARTTDTSPGLSVTPRSEVEARRSTTSTPPASARSAQRRRILAPRPSRPLQSRQRG